MSDAVVAMSRVTVEIIQNDDWLTAQLRVIMPNHVQQLPVDAAAASRSAEVCGAFEPRS